MIKAGIAILSISSKRKHCCFLELPLRQMKTQDFSLIANEKFLSKGLRAWLVALEGRADILRDRT
jgi:hypothetical protein